jgi:GTP-binding protein EngB required for normal cell division
LSQTSATAEFLPVHKDLNEKSLIKPRSASNGTKITTKQLCVFLCASEKICEIKERKLDKLKRTEEAKQSANIKNKCCCSTHARQTEQVTYRALGSRQVTKT